MKHLANLTECILIVLCMALILLPEMAYFVYVRVRDKFIDIMREI